MTRSPRSGTSPATSSPARAPRPGGGVFWTHARARAPRRRRASSRRRAAPRIAPSLLPPLEAFGLPVTWHESSTTTAYSFHYEGDRRIMWQDAVGDPWTPEQAVAAAGDATWINVCALTRTDFPAGDARRARRGRTAAPRRPPGPRSHRDDRAAAHRRAHRRRSPPRRGAEAERRGGRDARRQRRARAAARARRARGDPHARLAGCVGRHARRSSSTCRPFPSRATVDPTGAGDTYSVTYIVQRAAGAEPVEAARVAAATVSAFLAATLEAELAARDDDRAAAAVHALDLAARALGAGEERRRTPDLDALRDLDPLAPLDEPVPAEVARDRPGGRAGRGILADAARTCASSSALPSPRSSSRRDAERRDRRRLGRERLRPRRRSQRDDDVRRAVVVELDRQRPSARRRARRGAPRVVRERLDGRAPAAAMRPNTSAPDSSRSSSTGTSPDPGLELDDAALERLREHPRRSRDWDARRSASRRAG